MQYNSPRIHRLLVLFCACFLSISCTSEALDAAVATAPFEELYTVADREALLSAARSIIESDQTAALVSVDSDGRPRIRTVNTTKPDSAMSIWIATRPGTRKVDQIRHNPNVALYYNVDNEISYLSIMGTAILHEDLETIQTRNPFGEQWTRQFFPEYPNNMLLIEIQPTWLEVMGHGIAASDTDWRPQAVSF